MSHDSQAVVVVTGASSGFGRAIALDLAAAGYRVFGACRSPEKIALAGVTGVRMDVRQDASVSAAIDSIVSESGRIDVLINNAGYGLAGALEDTAADELQAQFETNFFGLHRVCRAVTPHMRTRKSGHIVNISSLAGLTAIPFQGAYSASKFAIEGYSASLRMELRPFGIAVAMIEPGDYATGFTAQRQMTRESGPQSAYHVACSAAIAKMAHDEQANTALGPVVRAARKIIESRAPALRHARANAVQRLFNGLRPYLPDALIEYLVADTYGLR